MCNGARAVPALVMVPPREKPRIERKGAAAFVFFVFCTFRNTS
jgi:hypothetical protein